MLELTIKKYELEDEENLKELIILCNEDTQLMNIVNGSRLELGYTAYYQNRLVGSLIVWKSHFHPNCVYFRIVNNPFYHLLNIEEQLLSKFNELSVKILPLQTSLWETSFNLIELYTRSGYNEIRRTYMPRLKIANLAKYIPNNCIENNIKSLAEVLTNETIISELTMLVKRNYEESHLANPVAILPIEQWQKMILAEDVILKGSFLYFDKEEKIIAYSFLHESDTDDSLELGWCGANQIEHKHLIPKLTF